MITKASILQRVLFQNLALARYQQKSTSQDFANYKKFVEDYKKVLEDPKKNVFDGQITPKDSLQVSSILEKMIQDLQETQLKLQSQRQEDLDGGYLKEFSVIYTDRSVNLMSDLYINAMKTITSELQTVYNAEQCVLLPGSGTFGMEAVARQYATNKKCMVIRNGLFSFRWTQIFDSGKIPSEQIIMKARPAPGQTGANPQYIPCPVEEVVASIKKNKPQCVFAPHVETATGIMLPNDYIKQVADAVHSVGGIFVLDGIASGVVWVDMKSLGVDVYTSAPQKGWSSPACTGIVMLSKNAKEMLSKEQSSSFAMDLGKWSAVSDAYQNGGFLYHTTPPTDGIMTFKDCILETKAIGYDKVNQQFYDLGNKTRETLLEYGFKAVAADGFEAPGVKVSYADKPDYFPKFKSVGLQVAGGCPWFLDEEKNDTFRIGLFGLDKWSDVDGTVGHLKNALEKVTKL